MDFKVARKIHLLDLRNLGFSLFGCERLGPMIGLQSLSGRSWRWPSLSTRYDKIRNSTFSGKYQKRQRPSLTSSTKTFIYILIWVVLHRCPRVANITLDKAPWSLSLKHRFLCAWSSMQLQWSNWLSQYIQYKNQIEHWSSQKKSSQSTPFQTKHWTYKLSKVSTFSDRSQPILPSASHPRMSPGHQEQRELTTVIIMAKYSAMLIKSIIIIWRDKMLLVSAIWRC